MNSKDRRKHNRKFPFSVEIKRDFMHDPSYDEIDLWCNERFGKHKWENHSKWYFHTYKFKLEKHKTLFILRWA